MFFIRYDKSEKLMERKPKYMSDKDIANEVKNNISLFQDVRISQSRIQAVYGVQRDRAAVMVSLVGMLIEA